MRNDLSETLCRMAGFLLCARMLIHLRPKASYEKYIRLLAGIMGLLLFLEPLSALLGLAEGGVLSNCFGVGAEADWNAQWQEGMEDASMPEKTRAASAPQAESAREVEEVEITVPTVEPITVTVTVDGGGDD